MPRRCLLMVMIFAACLVSNASADDEARGRTPDAPPARVEAVKAGIVQYETVVGRIEAVDRIKSEIVIVDEKKVKRTILLRSGEAAKLRKGQRLKIEVEAATGKAGRIVPLESRGKQKKRQG